MPRDFPHCFHRLLCVRVSDRGNSRSSVSDLQMGYAKATCSPDAMDSSSSYEAFIHVIDRQLVEVSIKSH